MGLVANIKKSFAYKWIVNRVHILMVKISPKYEMNRYYKPVFHKKIDFDNPRNLIEKIYWLTLNTDLSLWTKCADKYLVRDYLKEKGLDCYLPQLLGKWDSASEIDFTNLPREFILKANNGCEACFIVNDKNKESLNDIKKKLRQTMSLPFGYGGAQLHYTRIKPCIIAEELLHEDGLLAKISPNSMVDYKVWCVGNNPECIFVGYNRRPGMLNMALYDIDWNSISDNLVNTDCDIYIPDVEIPKPKCLNEMIEIATKIAKDFSEVRVDFYVVNDKPLIGELTFTSGYGYFTEEYYEYLGSKVRL